MGAPRNSVVHNVIDVLRCFSAEHPLVGVTEIADQVGLHKSSVSRLLSTLETEGWVEQDVTTRKYQLGLGLIAVAGPLLANLNVRKVAYPYLQELAENTQETTVLTIWEKSSAVTVEQIASERTIKHTSPLGARYDSTGSASVQIFLADMEASSVQTLLDREVTRLQQGWTHTQLTQRLEKVRQQGYATNLRETYADEIGIAAPVYDHRNQVVASVLIAAPAYRVDETLTTHLIDQCVKTAAKISTRMGNPESAENDAAPKVLKR